MNMRGLYRRNSTRYCYIYKNVEMMKNGGRDKVGDK